MKAIMFRNWTNEDFTHTWDNVPYTFPAGASMMMEDWKCEHFAYHLAHREVQKAGREGHPDTLKEFIKKCITEPETKIEETSRSKMDTELLNANAKAAKK
jgi:DNA polymerase III alpha subunit (gram-positive type)